MSKSVCDHYGAVISYHFMRIWLHKNSTANKTNEKVKNVLIWDHVISMLIANWVTISEGTERQPLFLNRPKCEVKIKSFFRRWCVAGWWKWENKPRIRLVCAETVSRNTLWLWQSAWCKWWHHRRCRGFRDNTHRCRNRETEARSVVGGNWTRIRPADKYGWQGRFCSMILWRIYASRTG